MDMLPFLGEGGCGARGTVGGIDHLVEENRVLKEQLRGRRLRLTDAQRRRLASTGKPSGPIKVLATRSSHPNLLPTPAVTSPSVNALAACCGTTTVPRPDGHEGITFMLRPPRRERDRSGVVRPSS